MKLSWKQLTHTLLKLVKNKSLTLIDLSDFDTIKMSHLLPIFLVRNKKLHPFTILFQALTLIVCLWLTKYFSILNRSVKHIFRSFSNG